MLTRMKTLATTLLLAGTIAIPAWACNCQPIPEQEPNAVEQPQTVGIVDQNMCLTISGTIATGYDDYDQRNPGMDLDAFVLSVPPGAHVQVTYGSLDQTDEFLFMWRDARSNEKLEMQCGDWQEDDTVVCQGISASDMLMTTFSSRLPEDYTITVTLGGNTVPVPVPTPAPAPAPTPAPLRSAVDASSDASNGSEHFDVIDRLR